tara:strand:- start:664 stop:1539 length:876 start_codon:yes stop_codon:yes gene_type:complete
MKSVVKPNFIFVGGTRCASQYITKVLSQHPDIFMARGGGQAGKRDVHFFSEDLTDNYFSQFKGRNEKVIGEIRGYYLYMKSDSGESIAKKIYEFNPEIKILISLRNPIYRTFSHYSKLVREEKFTGRNGFMKDYDRIMNEAPTSGYNSLSRIITDSLYYEAIKSYVDLFTEKNVKIIFHDTLESNPEVVFREIYSFLNIDEDYLSPVINSRINTVGMLGHRKSLSSLLYRLSVKLGFYSISKFFFRFVPTSPRVDAATHSFLSDTFEQDIIKLESYLNIDLSSWKEPYSYS